MEDGKRRQKTTLSDVQGVYMRQKTTPSGVQGVHMRQKTTPSMSRIGHVVPNPDAEGGLC